MARTKIVSYSNDIEALSASIHGEHLNLVLAITCKMLDIEEGGALLVPIVSPSVPQKNTPAYLCIGFYVLIICIFVALLVLYILRVY